MLYALDLTRRQTRRVLEQAAITGARFEIEPRHVELERPLRGTLQRADSTMLTVQVADDAGSASLPGLIGAFCDVHAYVGSHVYLFSASVLDARDEPPRRLLLSAPDGVQVENRRRFVRRAYPRQTALRVITDDGGTFSGQIFNVCGTGAAARVPRERDGVLLIGEPVRLQFRLAELNHEFDLDAIVCHKTRAPDREALTVGFEFNLDPSHQAQAVAIERLRAFLSGAECLDEEVGE